MTAPGAELPESWEFLVVRGLIDLCVADNLTAYQPGGFPNDYPGVASVLLARPDAPERLLSWTPYPVTQDPSEPMDRLGVQVWMRYAGRNPRAVLSLASSVRDTLDGLAGVELSTGVSMSLCARSSGTSLGQDAAGRWTRVENFYVDAHHATAHRN